MRDYYEEQGRFADILIHAMMTIDRPLGDLALAIVSGTYVEYLLRQLIASKADVARLESNERPFELGQLVRVAEALNLIEPAIAKAILGLARLRNKYAHRIGYQLDAADIESLRRACKDSLSLLWHWDAVSDGYRIGNVEPPSEELALSRDLRSFVSSLTAHLHESLMSTLHDATLEPLRVKSEMEALKTEDESDKSEES